MCHSVSASSTAMPKRGLRSYDVCVTIYSNLTRLLLHEQQHSHLGLGWVRLGSPHSQLWGAATPFTPFLIASAMSLAMPTTKWWITFSLKFDFECDPHVAQLSTSIPPSPCIQYISEANIFWMSATHWWELLKCKRRKSLIKICDKLEKLHRRFFHRKYLHLCYI